MTVLDIRPAWIEKEISNSTPVHENPTPTSRFRANLRARAWFADGIQSGKNSENRLNDLLSGAVARHRLKMAEARVDTPPAGKFAGPGLHGRM